MANNIIVLEWNELIKVSEDTIPDSNNYGVYLWGFTIDRNFIPYYIGIADDITKRIYEDIKAILGGLYTIYHRDDLAEFYQFKNKAVNPNKSCGKIYTPNWPKDYKTFIEERHLLQEHIDYMVDSFTFSYATVTPEEIPRKDLKEIEKICIRQIGKDKLANTRSGLSNRFYIEHKGNSIITDIFTSKKTDR